MITKEQLILIAGSKYVTDDLMLEVDAVVKKYSINTRLRMCHFLAQVLHESACFKFKEENLNYSEQGLLKVFSKYFTPLQAKSYARKPEKIANRVYANRMGNGDEASGDGWKYRGRGYIQLTGKWNYASATIAIGIDFLNSPETAKSGGLIVAGWFWNSKNLNKLADSDNLIGITRVINGGLKGLEDRKKHLEKCKSIIS
jgi:putative chitinase